MTAELVDSEAINARISRTVVALMAARGLTRKELAATVGMDEDTLGRRINRHSAWKADEVLAIAAAFEVASQVILETDPEDWFRPASPPVARKR